MRRANLQRGAAAACAAAALFVAAPAHAAQLDPHREPHRSGPVVERAHGCESRLLRHEGRVLARATYCYWLYEFDPLLELDLERDHAVAWLQTSVEPRNNWCVTKVSSLIAARAPLRIERAAPATDVRLARPRAERVELHVDAGGAALEDAHLRQDLRQFPRRLSVSTSAHTHALAWRGRTSRTVAAALGVATSSGSLDLSRRRYGLGLGGLRFERGSGCRSGG